MSHSDDCADPRLTSEAWLSAAALSEVSSTLTLLKLHV